VASYVIFEPPGAPQRERAVFVRDGFHWLAFLLSVFWLLWYRLWIEAGLVFAAMVGLSALGDVEGLQAAAVAVSFLLAFGLGFEAPALRMAALRRRGWREWGAVEANSGDEAAIRYLADAGASAASEPTYEPSAPPSAPAAVRRRGTAPALGLLHYPGHR
jgi:hypothetical protein